MTVRKQASSSAGPSSRARGDDLADDAVKLFVKERGERDLNAAWHRAIAREPAAPNNGYEPPAVDRQFAEFVLGEEEIRCLRNGQRFFATWGPLLGAAYLTCALPSTYAAKNGVHALWMTGRLQTDPKRRVIETCELLLEVMRPQPEGLDARAMETIRRVRLMHAYVRVLLSEGSWRHRGNSRAPLAGANRARRTAVRAGRMASGTWRAARATLPGSPCGDRSAWNATWGVPLNQDDLAATLMAFSFLPISALDNESPPVDYDEALANDYIRSWSIIAPLLGIDETIVGRLPRNRAEAGARWEEFASREFGESCAGKEMVNALIRSVERDIPGRFLDPLIHEMFYFQLSHKPASSIRETAAEALGLRRRTVWKYVYFLVRWLLRSVRLQERLLRGTRDARAGGTERERFGYDVFHWVVTRSSVYRKRPFALPEELREVWNWPAPESDVLKPRQFLGMRTRPISQDSRVRLASQPERESACGQIWSDRSSDR